MGGWVHRLTEVEPETRSGTCQNCGPVALVRNNGKGWRCKIGYDLYRRGYRAGRVLPPGYVKTDHCEQCGFVAEHPCQLDIDHKDGDPGNGRPENIWTLCANCHRIKSWKETLK